MTSQVRDYLLDRIMDDGFDSGVIYSVSDTAAQLEVSRTPVREAVLQLQELGLLEMVQHKGFSVVKVTDADVLAAFQIRHVLEPIAAATAAREALSNSEIRTGLQLYFNGMEEAALQDDIAKYTEQDKLFHDVLIDAADNPYLARAVRDARAATYRHRVFARATWKPLAGEHGAIMDAVLRGDADTAADEMRSHIRITGEFKLDRIGYARSDDWLQRY